ncbi:PIN domain-containing protein [Mycolicibacter heraklionensis]|uniref:PIN domain-containing protein n=1 Tax=Mycolicibacter heraklionensis TaxID=512402 RepID=UPI001A970B1F|nr:PIN domain-containing protein [Mycolicibacter heraklionensis]
MHTTSVSLAEIEYGNAGLPNERRRDQLIAAAARVFIDFDDMVMPFDALAGRSYAGIVIARETVGRPISIADAQVAAICASRQATLATRNTRDFDATGIHLVNPWID